MIFAVLQIRTGVRMLKRNMLTQRVLSSAYKSKKMSSTEEEPSYNADCILNAS